MVGKPRAFVHFFIVIAVLGIALAFGSRTLNTAIGLLGVAFLLVGSIAALCKMWRERDNPQANTFPSRIGWLPKKWQKWMLGEIDDDTP